MQSYLRFGEAGSAAHVCDLDMCCCKLRNEAEGAQYATCLSAIPTGAAQILRLCLKIPVSRQAGLRWYDAPSLTPIE